MTNSILIGELIYNAIMEDETLKEAIHYQVWDEKLKQNIDKYAIFPLRASNDTPFPLIVYARTNVYSEKETKDGVIGDKVGFQIIVGSDQYFESIELANQVRELFENCVLYNDSLTIRNIKMTSITEAFLDDTYIQTLNFECSAT